MLAKFCVYNYTEKDPFQLYLLWYFGRALDLQTISGYFKYVSSVATAEAVQRWPAQVQHGAARGLIGGMNFSQHSKILRRRPAAVAPLEGGLLHETAGLKTASWRFFG